MLKFSWFSAFFLGITYIVFAQSTKPIVTVYTRGNSQEYSLSKAHDGETISFLSVDSPNGKLNLSPSDIEGFKLSNGKVYRSCSIRNTEEKIFIQLLLEGAVSLGYLNSKFFLILDQEAIPLTEDSRGQGGPNASNRKTYLGVLHYAMDGCSDDLTSQINNTKLSFPSLQKLFIAYQNCKGLNYQIHRESDPYVNMGFSLAAGYSQINTELKPYNKKFESSGLRIEALAQFDLTKFFPRIRPEIGLGYLGFEDQWIVGRKLNPGQEQFYYSENYKMDLIDLMASINYKIIQNRNQELYVGVGTKFTIIKKEALSTISQYEYMRPEPPHPIIVLPRDPVVLEMQNKFGYLVKVGYLKKLGKVSPFAEFQYEQLSNFGFLTLRFNNLHKFSATALTGKVGIRF